MLKGDSRIVNKLDGGFNNLYNIFVPLNYNNMPTTKVFYDESSEMKCYQNDKGDLYIGIFDKEDEMYFGTIVLKRQDVKELIAELQQIEPFINEE
jgi:hypothetical protein